MLQDNIKTIRKSRGMTQEDLAIQLHVTRQTISKWEKGYSVPDADILSHMANVLHVSVGDLLGNPTSKKEDSQYKAIVEQLSRLNDMFAVKEQRRRKKWKYIKIILPIILIVAILLPICLVEIQKSRVVAGSASWWCSLDGKRYMYTIDYNSNYRILSTSESEVDPGGTNHTYISDHINMNTKDAREASKRLKTYFKEHGGLAQPAALWGLPLPDQDDS